MSRIASVDPNYAQGKTQELLGAVKQKLGKVPNMMKAMAQAPAVLDAYLKFSGALSQGSFSPGLREQIALAVGEANHCGYCIAAHSMLGKHAGLSEEQLVAARKGKSSDRREQAVLHLARQIVEKRGQLTPTEVSSAKSSGLNDSDIAEVIGLVSLNIFTNYFNHVADPEIDFPAPSTGKIPVGAAE